MSNSVDHPQHEYGFEGDSPTVDSAPIASLKAASEESPREKSAESSREKSYDELRSSPRKKYQASQRIGPMHGGLMPTADEFFTVECNDISAGGISFFLRRPPGCELFAIVLGQKPRLTILAAKVVYFRPVKHNGQQMYLVGCKFLDRMPT